jgi:hypothetical protein
MWLGLRLTEAGVGRVEFRSAFGEDYYARFKKEIDSSLADGLAEWLSGEFMEIALTQSPPTGVGRGGVRMQRSI